MRNSELCPAIAFPSDHQTLPQKSKIQGFPLTCSAIHLVVLSSFKGELFSFRITMEKKGHLHLLTVNR